MSLVAAYPARAQEGPKGPCFDFDLDEAVQVLPRVSMVVVGEVIDAVPGERAIIEPSLYLKGPTSAEELMLPYRETEAGCNSAELPAGERVLLVLGREDGRVAWPGESQVFLLRDGRAYQGSGDGPSQSELELIDRIRGVTGQYSIPAQTEDERARLDWTGTVIPVGLAVLVVFGIGLVLMREWHRIDPS